MATSCDDTLSVQEKAVIQKIWHDLSEKRKTLTEDGKKRKERIFDKVLFQEKKTLLVLNFYNTVLPLLKSYVCLFQSSEPLIHKLNDKQELLRQFLSNFVDPERSRWSEIGNPGVSEGHGPVHEENSYVLW